MWPDEYHATKLEGEGIIHDIMTIAGQYCRSWRHVLECRADRERNDDVRTGRRAADECVVLSDFWWGVQKSASRRPREL